jgi:hypothetical protein
MRAYLVDLIDPKSQVHQRIWVKVSTPVSAEEMQDYVLKLDGLKVKNPKLVSLKEKNFPYSIRQELIEKKFSVFTK